MSGVKRQFKDIQEEQAFEEMLGWIYKEYKKISTFRIQNSECENLE